MTSSKEGIGSWKHTTNKKGGAIVEFHFQFYAFISMTCNYGLKITIYVILLLLGLVVHDNCSCHVNNPLCSRISVVLGHILGS